MSDPYIAEIRAFSFGYAPRGWALCQGQILPIQQNTALFSLLGTTYGGNGTTTFGLPDLRGRVPVGAGAGPGLSQWNQGQLSGTENVTLTSFEIPAHNHPLAANTGNATSNNPSNAVPARGRAVVNGTTAALPMYQTPGSQVAMASPDPVGSGQPHENRMPSLAIYSGIALSGIFPSRN